MERIIIEMNGNEQELRELLEPLHESGKINIIHIAICDDIHKDSIVQNWRDGSKALNDYVAGRR